MVEQVINIMVREVFNQQLPVITQIVGEVYSEGVGEDTVFSPAERNFGHLQLTSSLIGQGQSLESKLDSLNLLESG